MTWKLTTAQLQQILKRVLATYAVSFVTAMTASQFDWHVSSLEKAGIAGLTPVLVLLQSVASSYLAGTPALIASVRLLVVGRSAPAKGLAYGKLGAVHDARTLRLVDYLAADLPPAPPSLSWAQRVVALGMMLNDRLGDCTIAAMGHAIQIWTSNLLHQFTVSDALIQAKYSQLSGYDPVTGANDNGCVELEVLKDWRTNGIGGHKIGAFMAVDTRDVDHLKQAINLMGLVYVGTNVPRGWEQAPAVWDVIRGRGGQIVGGHAIIYVGYDADGFWIVSWGQLFKLTYRAHAKYVDETYAVVSPDWVGADGQSPSGFNSAQLTTDLQALAS